MQRKRYCTVSLSNRIKTHLYYNAHRLYVLSYLTRVTIFLTSKINFNHNQGIGEEGRWARVPVVNILGLMNFGFFFFVSVSINVTCSLEKRNFNIVSTNRYYGFSSNYLFLQNLNANKYNLFYKCNNCLIDY